MASETHPLRAAREDAGIQQQELAQIAGISNALLSMMENGYEGKDSTRRNLAQRLGRSVADIWPGLYSPTTEIPIVGGPLNGQTNPADAPRHCFVHRTSEGPVRVEHLYVLQLNGDRECWVYRGSLSEVTA